MIYSRISVIYLAAEVFLMRSSGQEALKGIAEGINNPVYRGMIIKLIYG